MRRRVGLFLFCGLVLPLAAAANASAQGAVLEVSPSTAVRGVTVVKVTGAAYNQPNANVGGVQIRLGTRDAEPVATALPDSSNRIETEFQVPASLAVGEHLVIATQTTVRNRQMFGGPGRAKLKVVAGAAGTAAPPARSPNGTVIALGTGILALILLAGTALAVPRLRTLHRSAASRRNVDFSR